MQELIYKVEEWAEARNLITGSDPTRQIYKTMEEATELAVAIGKWERSLSDDNSDIKEHIPEIMDAIGDITVTLIIVAKQMGLKFEDCLAQAYEDIKDRKGKMVGGLFVKDFD